MTTLITDKMINKLNVPEKGSRITYDTEIRGFGIRVTSTGQKSFIFNYTIFGRERRFTIGRYDEWSSTAARNKAKELRRIVDNGGDPQEQKMVERAATTVKELYTDYQKHHLFKLEPRHQKDVEAMWRDYILPSLGNKRLKDLTGKDIDALHNKISAVKAVRANRVVANLRSVLNLAMRWQLIEKNPAIGFKRNPEEHREIFLTKDQLVQVFKRRVKWDYEGKRRFTVGNAQKNWTTVPAEHLRIIDDQLWAQVQRKYTEISEKMPDRKYKNKGDELGSSRRPKYLTTGKLECAECGGGMSISSNRIRCSSWMKGSGCKNNLTADTRKIDARILDFLKRQLLTPERLGQFLSAYRQEMEVKAKDIRTLLVRPFAMCKCNCN